MGSKQEQFERLRKEIQYRQTVGQEEREQLAESMRKAMYDLANDLVYPVDADGNVMRVHELIPFLSYHLARCGYRKHEDEAVITQVPVPPTAGVVEDAVKYVPIDAPGFVPSAFIPPAEAPERPNTDGWKVKPHITLDGETIRGGNR